MSLFIYKMAEKPVTKEYLTLFTVPAYIENVHASALGTGVKAQTMIDRGRRRIQAGEPLNFWATAGTKPEGEIKLDHELLEDRLSKKDVFMIFRQPPCAGCSVPKTRGLARMLQPRNSPYTRPFPGWPRRVSTGAQDAGWMRQIPFPVEWYFTCDIDDKELGLQKSNLTAHFTECPLGTEFALLKLLHKATKIQDPTKMHMINAEAFAEQARKYDFVHQGLWEGKIVKIPLTLPTPKPKPDVIVLD
jgi:hypothetical protein